MRTYLTLCVQIIIITIQFLAILFSMYPLRWALQGMELYPRISKNFDIKIFTNCRFGMMSWAVLAITYCIKQVLLDIFPLCYDITWMFLWVLIWSESLTLLICGPYIFLYQYEINGRVSDSMLVNTILMLVYVTKFFGWEAGYWNSMDIAHDRGTYIKITSPWTKFAALFGHNILAGFVYMANAEANDSDFSAL